jgi:WD40 repeat protein
MSVCFSPDGNLLASDCDDHTVWLWDTYIGERRHVLRGHMNAVQFVCFSPDGNVLASASDDDTVRLWDRHSGECLHVLQGHTKAVLSVCFSPDGNLLASGSADETIRFWDLHTGACLRVLRSERPYERMNITEATSLTPAQIATLKRLGAVDDSDQQSADSLSKP